MHVWLETKMLHFASQNSEHVIGPISIKIFRLILLDECNENMEFCASTNYNTIEGPFDPAVI